MDGNVPRVEIVYPDTQRKNAEGLRDALLEKLRADALRAIKQVTLRETSVDGRSKLLLTVTLMDRPEDPPK